MNPSLTTHNELIRQTHKVWQPRFPRKLSDEDARQIAENVTGFFRVLAEWSRTVTPVAPSTNASASSSRLEIRHVG